MKKQLLLGLLMVTMAGQVFAGVSHAAEAPQAAAAQQVSTSQTGNIIASVNLRKEPSTSSSVIRLMKKGEKVTILDKHNSSWYKVKDEKGNTGYMSTSSKYIQVAESGTANQPSDKPSVSDQADSSSRAAKIEKVIQVGEKYLGTPYEFGSNRNSTKTFDCSAFVRQAYKEALGIVLPTDSRKQGSWIKSNSTAKTSISQLKRGDLMFFMSYKGSKASDYKGVNKSTERITHVGIYLGDGKILHTYSQKSGGVRVNNVLNTTWEHRFLFGGSVVK
ncbi:C40 family peptidase [Paenibacillus dendritiformis]|uniref:NLP/P60 family protein n=1 Tax=Paenibacillus dendritiformis C454 TaxID=1131935 RepID=H3SHK5_9BACL|nr:SH3 domain-containing C40 family peptidase [Paenibacillus dendritiformis]EHQ61465.1 NLP/P60 family protein [Paenibacillus dendritiformis C454]CAH8772970.1 C40 family peptidase [Paenibacillus dendritiformis]